MTATIFDIDGTLTDTTKVDDKCFIQAFFNVFGIDISNKDWSEFQNVTDWGITEEVISKEWKREPTNLEFEKMELEFVRLLKDEFRTNKKHFKEINGASTFVQIVNQNEDTVSGIATGGWEKSATLKLKAIGIDPSDYAFSNSSHFKKREDILLDTIQQTIKKANKPIDRIVYFGDGSWDFLTCKKIGIEFIGIDSRKNGKLAEMGAKHIFADFSQPDLIFKHIENLNNTANRVDGPANC